MTPYSAAAGGSFSSRAELALGGLAHVLRQARRARRAARAAPFTSACSGSPSPSSCWIAFSCWRRKYSRWPFSISDWTCDWIFEPSSNTSSSRLRIAETLRSRSSTLTVSRISCRSSVLIVRSVEATRCASALGSSTFAAASCSSSGRYGASPMMRANRPWTLRVSASTSGVSSSTSGSALNSPSRYGSVSSRCVEPDAVEALDEDAQRPVGHLDHLVDERDRADLVDVVPAGRVDRRVARGDEREQPVAGDDVVDQPHRALLADRERRHRLREDDRLLERQHRQRSRELELDGSGRARRGVLERERRSCAPHLDRDAARAAAPASTTGSSIVRTPCSNSRRARVGSTSSASRTWRWNGPYSISICW